MVYGITDKKIVCPLSSSQKSPGLVLWLYAMRQRPAVEGGLLKSGFHKEHISQWKSIADK